MIRTTAVVTALNSHAPSDGPGDVTSSTANGLGTLLHRTLNCMKVVFSVAVDGGGQTTKNMNDDQGNPAILPPSAVLIRSFMNWTTAGVGTNGTFSWGVSTTTDIKNALAVASCTGLVEGVQTGTTANATALGTTSSGYRITSTIATTNYTAGVCNLYLWWVL